MWSWRRSLGFGLTMGCLLTLAAFAADVQVNVDDGATTSEPAVARQPSGETYFVWDEGGIVGRRFDALGTPLDATPFEVSNPPPTSAGKPEVAMNASGQVVVVWQSPTDGNDLDILGRLDTFDGAGPAPTFQINLFDSGDQFLPKVAMASDGQFAVAYKSFGFDGDDTAIVLRRFDAAGQPLDNEQQVNVSGTGSQIEPNLAMGASSQLAITWIDDANGANRQLYLRLFDSSGSPTSGAIEVADGAFFGGVAVSPLGNILVVWSGPRVAGRLFDPMGMPLTDAFFLDEPDQAVGEVVVTPLSSGDFQVVWTQSPQNTLDDDLLGLVVEHGGALVGSPALVAVTRQGIQDQPNIDANGDFFVVAFRSPDDLGPGIFTTCLTPEGCTEIFKDGFETGNSFEWDDTEP